jgi:DNA-binding NtrC family response regulator
MEFPLIGVSDTIEKLRKHTQRDHLSQANIVISGEPGVGKELFARHCYLQSIKKKRPFIKIDYAAYCQIQNGDGLCRRIKGLLEGKECCLNAQYTLPKACVLFIDEIEAGRLKNDWDLLQLLKYRSLRPNSATGADIWILAGVHLADDTINYMEIGQTLRKAKGVDNIYIPPLRRRVEDIPFLFDFYWDYFTSDLKRLTLKRPPNIIMKALSRHRWPGNIEELKSLIKDAVTIGDWNKTLEEYAICQ